MSWRDFSMAFENKKPAWAAGIGIIHVGTWNMVRICKDPDCAKTQSGSESVNKLPHIAKNIRFLRGSSRWRQPALNKI